MGEVLDAQDAARRDLRRVRRARRRFRQARGRAGEARGDHRARAAPTPTCRWRSPPTRCGCRRGTRRSARCPAARSAASRCAGCCCRSPTCCCSTSRPTTSMPRASSGSSSSCRNFRGTVVAVTHDRYFLDNAAEWILELDRGYGIPWKGNYSSWLEQKEAAARRPREAGSARGSRRCKRELEWVRAERQGPAGQEQGAHRALRGTCRRYEHQKRNETQEIFIPVAERLGNEVIEFKNVTQGLRRPAADRRPVVPASRRARSSASSARTAPARSTLFRMITGKEKPDAGEIVIGPHRAARGRRPDARVAAERQDRLGRDLRRPGHPHRRQVRDAVARVSRAASTSRAATSRRSSAQLSGGERGRLHLAATLLRGGNVLLLDEPSNDLDVETLRALEDALLEFAGTVLVISHDRWFLDRIATHILASEGDSKWSCSSRATTRNTRPTRRSAWARMPRARGASGTRR